MDTNLGSFKVPPAFLLVFPILFIMVLAPICHVSRNKEKENGVHGLTDSTEPLPITFLWVALRYLFLGSADLFTLTGMMEFFFTKAPWSMRSLATALSWASLAMGYYSSTVLESAMMDVDSSVDGCSAA
ncbi:hypothetical protein AHAS_Ahas19G0334900 [Arachis hypogaea]